MKPVLFQVPESWTPPHANRWAASIPDDGVLVRCHRDIDYDPMSLRTRDYLQKVRRRWEMTSELHEWVETNVPETHLFLHRPMSCGNMLLDGGTLIFLQDNDAFAFRMRFG